MSSASSGYRMSLDEVKALSVTNDDLVEYLAHHPQPVIPPTTDPTAGRQMNALRTKATLSNLGAPHPSITQYKLQIPVRDGWLSRSIVCRPSSPAAPGPVIVIYHGGGFWTGNPEGMLNYARRLSQSLDAVIVCPSYRLAPEDPFPIGVNDAWDVLVWLSSNASSINADLGKGFIVGGNSAGANFAGVLARRAVEENLQPPVTGQWISFPAFGHVGIEGVEQAIMVPEAERYQHIWGMSWSQNEDAMIVNQEYAAEILGWYNSDYTSPLYNPLTAKPPLDMGKMPKAFIQIAGGDLFRDDGIVYAYALGDAGVDVRLEAYSGVPHTFPFFLPMLEVSKKATVDTAMGFAWLLNIEIDEGVAVKSMQGNA